MNDSLPRQARAAIFGLFMGEPEILRALALKEPGIEGLLSQLNWDDEDIPEENLFYSGPRPHLFLLQQERGVLIYGLWLFARELYLSPDRADLSAWLDEGLPFTYELVSKGSFLRMSKIMNGVPLHNEQGRLGALLVKP